MSTNTMSPWISFLQAQGIEPEAAATGVDERGFLAPLTHLGLIEARGEDAAHFLHNQLSNDIEHLGPDQARLAAYCSPKGRMLASFLLWRTPEAIMLALSRDLQASVQKRLQMFVLRSKVKLADVSDTRVVLGIAGRAAGQALATLLDCDLPAAVHGKTESAEGSLLRLPDAGALPRYLWVTDAENAMGHWTSLAAQIPVKPSADWRLTDIEAGIARVEQATQEQFVPQMINFELVGGVNFRKGCYPGQEIVARSQYLGKLKRRTYLAQIAGTAAAGAEVFAESDPGQPGGQVVNAEARPDGSSLALVELKSALVDEGTRLHLGSADGPVLQLLPLPYPLTEPA